MKIGFHFTSELQPTVFGCIISRLCVRCVTHIEFKSPISNYWHFFLFTYYHFCSFWGVLPFEMSSIYEATLFMDVYEADGQRFKEARVKCNLCSKVMSKRLERQLCQLGYERKFGVRLNSVTLCHSLNPFVRDLFQRCGRRFPPHIGKISGAHSLPSSLDAQFVGTTRSTGGSSREGFSQDSPLTSTTSWLDQPLWLQALWTPWGLMAMFIGQWNNLWSKMVLLKQIGGK